jgi:lipoprotein-releasing system ATP-binding protein
MLTARNIHKSFTSLQVLRGVDIDIAAGEIVSIVGPSGSGKSTLLHILGTLDVPDTGSISIDSTLLQTLTSRQLADFRNKHIGFVFQFHHLLPEFSAIENVCIPGWIAGTNKTQVAARAASLLELLAVARALINQPKIIFADEPTGNLDSANARDLHQLFFNLRQQFNQTFLIVTHNEELAGMSDRTLHMKDGKIVL